MDPVITPSIFWSICGVVFGGGATYGVVRHQLQDQHDDHAELKKEFVAHKRLDDSIHKDLLDRTARIETKIDILLEQRHDR